jgi:hypothetical protein
MHDEHVKSFSLYIYISINNNISALDAQDFFDAPAEDPADDNEDPADKDKDPADEAQPPALQLSLGLGTHVQQELVRERPQKRQCIDPSDVPAATEPADMPAARKRAAGSALELLPPPPKHVCAWAAPSVRQAPMQKWTGVQCSVTCCAKWRKVPLNAELPETFTCRRNTWDAGHNLCRVTQDIAYEALQFPLLGLSGHGQSLVGHVLWAPPADDVASWEKVAVKSYDVNNEKPYEMEILLTQRAGMLDEVEQWEGSDLAGCRLLPIGHEAMQYPLLEPTAYGSDLVGRILWAPPADEVVAWEKVAVKSYDAANEKPYAMEILWTLRSDMQDAEERWRTSDLDGCRLLPKGG